MKTLEEYISEERVYRRNEITKFVISLNTIKMNENDVYGRIERLLNKLDKSFSRENERRSIVTKTTFKPKAGYIRRYTGYKIGYTPNLDENQD